MGFTSVPGQVLAKRMKLSNFNIIMLDLKLVVLVGLEPTTPSMSWKCATNCAKGRLCLFYKISRFAVWVQAFLPLPPEMN